ncbi:MAG: site-specific integrase [Desulfovermiculus sp.]|nr:site-specific integrase [Desulfovermiculus sp.]
MAVWHKSSYPGVRYREHATNLHNKKPDKYFSIRYKIDGKLKEEGIGWASDGWNERKASNLRAELLENQRRGEGPLSLGEKRREAMKAKEEERVRLEQIQEDKKTFRDIAKIFLKWGKRNKGDWRHDQGRFDNLILPMIGDMLIKEIQSAHIEQVKNACLDKGFSAANTRHYLQTIRATFNHAIRNGLYQEKNPVQNVKFPKQDNRRRRFLSFEEADILLEALQNRSQDMHDMALLSLHAGLRMGECFDICWHSIDWQNDVIHVMDTKNEESRPAYMTAAVKEMLQRREQVVENVLVFPSRDGDRYKKLSHTFYKTVKDLGWNDGIEDQRQRVVFHTLRHTFASWLAMQGEHLLTIKELLGHKGIDMTLRYAHLIPDHKRAAVDKLGQRSSGKVVDMEEVRRKKTG